MLREQACLTSPRVTSGFDMRLSSTDSPSRYSSASSAMDKNNVFEKLKQHFQVPESSMMPAQLETL